MNLTKHNNVIPPILCALAAVTLLTFAPTAANAVCVDPADDAPLDTFPGPGEVGAGAILSASASHPTLGKTLIASSRFLYRHDIETLEMNPLRDVFTASADIVNTPNPVQMNDLSYGVFIAQTNGIVQRVNAEAVDFTNTVAARDWQIDLTTGSCGSDSISATPVIQLNRFSSESFQKAYPAMDLVYVATRYGCGAGSTNNRVYALNAATGAIVWTFNGGGTLDVDVAYEAPFLDLEEDRLVLGTDRSSPSQDSLWSIDIITGTKAWSANVGQLWTTPNVRGNRVYLGSLAGEIKALNKTDGVAIWSVPTGLPILINIFAEFRSPYTLDPTRAEMIAFVDYFGQVGMVRDDKSTGTLLWTTILKRSLVTSVTAMATSRVAVEPDVGVLYVGADDGAIYQLAIADGTIQATRDVDAGTTVGDGSFVFSAVGELEIIAGSSSGVLSRFCSGWTTEAEFVPFAPVSATPQDTAAALGGFCFNPITDCPQLPCTQYSCVNNLCQAAPVPDGTLCDDRNPDTFGSVGAFNLNSPDRDVCNAGTCAGFSECQLFPQNCHCADENGVGGGASGPNRILYTTQSSACPTPPTGGAPLPAQWCGTETSARVAQNACIGHDRADELEATSVVWVHLVDKNRVPFDISTANGDVIMRLCGSNASTAGSGAIANPANDPNCPSVTGDRPEFVDANFNSFTSLGDQIKVSLTNGTLFASSRPGTYYAYISSPDRASEPSDTPSNPWNIRVDVNMKDEISGLSCFDTTEDFNGDQLDIAVLMGIAASTMANHPDACKFSSNQDHMGYLHVQIRKSNGNNWGTTGPLVQVGLADDIKYAKNYEEHLTNTHSLPNVKNGTGGFGVSHVQFTDFGNHMNGPVRVLATCPGGTIGDADTIDVEQTFSDRLVRTSEPQLIAIDCP